MSTFKKIGTVIVVLTLVTIYANIGYWIGQAEHDARGQVNPSTLDSFFLGPNRILEGSKALEDLGPLLRNIVFMALWPFLTAFLGLIWLEYFMFWGGLFRTIGLIPSVLTVIAGAIIARIWYINRPKKTKPIKT